MVEWFLDIDPNFVSAPNFCGRTPLHLAASKGSKELVTLLCTHGAPINALMMHKGQLLTPLDVAKRRGHEPIVEYLCGSCGALTAVDIPPEDKTIQRKSIEEKKKNAKLRKMHVEQTENEEMERTETLSLLRRGHSLWMPKRGSADREMVDAFTTMSRRSSLISGPLHFKKKVPRATSTTDLAQIAPIGTEKIAKQTNGQQREEAEAQDQIEKDVMEKTIQRIVKEELKKVKEVGQERVRENRRRGQTQQNSEENGESGRQSGKSETDEESGGRRQQQDEMPKQQTAMAEFRAKHSAREKAGQKRDDETKGDKNEKDKAGEEGTERRRIQRKATPRGAQKRREGEGTQQRGEDTEVTELHILEQGLSPPLSCNQQPIGRMAEFAEPTPSGHNAPNSWNARRYIHEKAIFDELTHLKRMQLQYKRVSEEVLVSSLVQNFCRMHLIHPAHFRRVHTFHHWEKFLYDQLKLIYLEERDRISAVAFAASQRAAVAAGAVGVHPTAVYSAQHRVFASSATTNGTTPSSALIQRKLHARVLPRADVLEERMTELSRIYGSGSSSRNSAHAGIQTLEDEHQKRRAMNENKKGVKAKRDNGEERTQRRMEETEEGESHL